LSLKKEKFEKEKNFSQPESLITLDEAPPLLSVDGISPDLTSSPLGTGISSALLHVITFDFKSTLTQCASTYVIHGPISARIDSTTVRVSTVPTLTDGNNGVIKK
jgi:hypothetical protein